MSEDKKYEVTRMHLDTANFDVLIMEIPKDEVNDKLTYLTREKGLVRKSLFDDFLIATCVSNLNDFLNDLSQKGTDLVKLNEIREELVLKILEINTYLNPDKLVINKNKVVKLKTRGQRNTTSLTKNEFWAKDAYKDSEAQMLKDKRPNRKIDMSKIRKVKDLDFIPVQKFWKRIGQYVTVKQFPEDSADIILGGREFNTRTSFEQYIVTICINEVEDLFVKLDALGLPNRVNPPTLVHELYNLCKHSNPFLSFNVYKEKRGEDFDENEVVDPFAQRSVTAGEELEPKRSKKIKLFKHVKKETLLNLGESIKELVIGQDKAIDDVVDALQRSSVGLKDPERPLGAFVFAGYSGCGKSYTAKILADKLIGSREALITVDCSEYSSDHEYAKLIGAPSGYIGHEHGGYLTNAVKKNPFSIILFDEIEKASEKVHQLLLQVMDEARLTDGKGHKVSFKDCVIIMTSNIGVKEVSDIGKSIGFGDAKIITDEKRTKAIENALKKKFKPEFLNRITSIINFNELIKEDYFRIIDLELDKLKINLSLSGTDYSQVKLEFDKSVKEHIYNEGIDEKYGARPLVRTIEKEISTPLARKMLNEGITGEAEVKISIEKSGIKLDVKKVEKTEDPPFYMEAGNGENKEDE